MLRPEYLAALPDRMSRLFEATEDSILCSMAKQISAQDLYITSTDWQYIKLREMGMAHDEILRRLSTLTGKTSSALTQLMRDAARESLIDDAAAYRAAGLIPNITESQALARVLNIGLSRTRGLFRNLTRTTASVGAQQFIEALDLAHIQVISGAFTPEEAVRMAVKSLAAAGLQAIRYPSGRSTSLDAAVRRATLTGVNQTVLHAQDALAGEMGCDLVEVSAHAGARTGTGVANHAAWQGKIYSRSGRHPRYLPLVDETGYGTGEGLGGWNCRHSMYPYFEGLSQPAYTRRELAEMNAPKYEYNGRRMTEYEATQKQRYIERQIRRYKRENLAMQAAGLDRTESAAKLRQWHAVQHEFLQQTGLKQQYARAYTEGFGRSAARKATQDAKVWTNMQEYATLIAQQELPKRVSRPDRVLPFTFADEQKFLGALPKGATLTSVYTMAGSDTQNVIRDWKRLYNLYGGDPRKWEKRSGDVQGKYYRYVLHWYERDGKIPAGELKTKGVTKQ